MGIDRSLDAVTSEVSGDIEGLSALANGATSVEVPFDFSEIDKLVDQQRAVRGSLNATFAAFFGRFASLRDIQLAAIPPVISGKDVLLIVSTAGGKTEAMIAPLLERLITEKWFGLSVIVIAPTRALVNDLYRRLFEPCRGLGVGLARRTGDYPLSSGSKAQIVIMTPESLEAELLKNPSRLETVRCAAIDEVHLLDQGPRGNQLRILLARLEARIRAAGREIVLQRIAASATVSEPSRVAAAYLGSSPTLAQIEGQRELEAIIILCSGSEAERAKEAMIECEKKGSKKPLVFVNSRRAVDEGAHHYRVGAYSRVRVFAHHGSLSKSLREEVERQFAIERRAVCIATATFELGMDIEGVDLVVLMDPPMSLSSLLQRAGRGCRHGNKPTRVVCVARNTRDLVTFKALLAQARRGMPESPLAPFRRSVLFQQVLAFLRQEHPRRMPLRDFADVFCSSARPAIGNEMLSSTLADMVLQGYLIFSKGLYELSGAGWEFVDGDAVFSNIRSAPWEHRLVDVDTGQLIATTRGGGQTGDHIQIAGQLFEVMAGGKPAEQTVRQLSRSDQGATSPRYDLRSFRPGPDVGYALREYFSLPKSALALFIRGREVIVMTWLGRVTNEAIAEVLRRQGLKAKGRDFALVFASKTQMSANDILGLIKSAADEAASSGGALLKEAKVESWADLGPHFSRLSSEEKCLARGDWVDAEFIREWGNGLVEGKEFSMGDETGETIFLFAK